LGPWNGGVAYNNNNNNIDRGGGGGRREIITLITIITSRGIAVKVFRSFRPGKRGDKQHCSDSAAKYNIALCK